LFVKSKCPVQDVIRLHLKEVVSNEDNSRDAFRELAVCGYGILEPIKGSDCTPMFALALGNREDQGLFRKLIDEQAAGLRYLIKSVAKRGLLQSIGVRKIENGYALVFGQRRCMAWLYNHCEDPKRFPPIIPATVMTGEGDKGLFESFEENCLRKDASPIDEAKLFQRLKDRKMSLRQIEQLMEEEYGYHRSHQTVKNYLQLLKLPLEDQDRIHEGRLKVATALMKLNASNKPNLEDKQENQAEQQMRPSTKKPDVEKLSRCRNPEMEFSAEALNRINEYGNQLTTLIRRLASEQAQERGMSVETKDIDSVAYMAVGQMKWDIRSASDNSRKPVIGDALEEVGS
jgi:ParB/RepB/Spo0J family partition protein